MTPNDLLEPLRRRRSRIEKLAERVRTLESTRQELQHAIAGYRAFEPELEKGKIERLEKTAADLSRKSVDQDVNKTSLERRLRDTTAAKANPLAVWKFFTAEQKQLRAEAGRLERELAATKQRLSGDQEALSKVRADTTTARRRLSDHESFNLKDAEKRLSSLGPEIERIRTDQAAASAELTRIETRIHPHTQQLDRLKSELATLNAYIARANGFEQDLSSASNSYERAMIHKECEEKFGTGSPKQVISDCRRKIRTLENNIPKLERRIRDELQKLERTIGHLLIDGNNACYEGQSFIGTRAISALLLALGGRYKTTIVFDASIRAMLKTDNQGVERILGTSGNTHVAPTKTAADEYLMKLADNDKNTFILSNDRFAEYHDYDAVESGRILRFLIAEGRLMINDIDIAVKF